MWVLVVSGYWQLSLFTLEEFSPIIHAQMMDVELQPQMGYEGGTQALHPPKLHTGPCPRGAEEVQGQCHVKGFWHFFKAKEQ